MIKIKFFNSIIAAELAKNLLKEYKIKSMLKNKGQRFPGGFGDSYGTDLFVAEKNAKEAKELLKIED